jgi:hypothetical protein
LGFTPFVEVKLTHLELSDQGEREATQSSVIPVNVVSVVIYFAPFSHPHRAIAPAVFEITMGQAMDALELVVFRV